MEFDVTFFALALPAAFVAGFAKGGFGGGAAFVGTAILALFLEPGIALGIMLPLLMAVDMATLRPYWKQWDLRAARALMLGSLPGIALGVAVYKVADADLLRFMIGLIALAFVAFQMARKVGWFAISERPFSLKTGLLAGAVAGFTSFVSHAGGPPAAMYLLSQNMGKTTYQATTVLAFWVINALKAVPYVFLGVFTWDTLRADMFMLPAALAGAVVGVYAHRALSERVFFAITYVLLTVTGIKLVHDGLF